MNASRPSKQAVTKDEIFIKENVNEKVPRALRGGAFCDQPANVRSAYRGEFVPSYRSIYGGFRPARTYP
jgi:formylglycine-generating enzyme required for sulfatase activity